MTDWIAQNSDVLNIGFAAVSAVIWLAYLHLFYRTVSRQRSPMVMIDSAAAEDDQARCIITNMGAEPIYVLAMIVRLRIDETDHHAYIANRYELALEDFDEPSRRSNQGPLKSGEFFDGGSFRDMIRRAGAADDASPEEIEVTLGAASGHASELVIASRTFERIAQEDGPARYLPTEFLTRQERGRWNRRKLLSRLQA